MPRRSGRHFSTQNSPIIALAGAGVLWLTGCQSVSEGINDLSATLNPTSPREAAKFALDQDDPDKRREGILLLSSSHFGSEEVYVQLYREYVRFESDPMVRAVAIQALARYGNPDDAIFIQPHLEDESIQVRREAAKGLQRLHSPPVVSELIRVLVNEGENADVRSAIAIALGQYPEDRVMQGLFNALDARELSVNYAALHSLRILTGEDFGLDSVEWGAWYRKAEAKGVAFDGQQEYFYPTYQRDLSWLEELAFWSKPTFEPPGQPAGLTPKGQRSTYQDKDPENPGGTSPPHDTPGR